MEGRAVHRAGLGETLPKVPSLWLLRRAQALPAYRDS